MELLSGQSQNVSGLFRMFCATNPTLNSYMAKNTPERKDYLMDTLVVPVVEEFKRSGS